MPLMRKLIQVGNNRAVVIPRDWLKCCEEKAGEPIQSVFMELDDVITIFVPGRNENQSEAAIDHKKG